MATGIIGGGDMRRSIYDTDNNGIVDVSETVLSGGTGTTEKDESFTGETAPKTGVDTELSLTLGEIPANPDAVRLFINGEKMDQATHYETTGANRQKITWLGSTGSPPYAIESSDKLDVTYAF